MAEHWKGQLDSILIFAGLFSATVTALIVESYKGLSPDSGDATVLLLTQIAQQLMARENGTQVPPTSLPTASFQLSKLTVSVNVLWFSSLMLSLTAAIGAIVVQQSTHDYQAKQFREDWVWKATPHIHARIHAYLLHGAKRWLLADAPDHLGLLLHASLFLFFTGLVVFLSDINILVYRVVLGITIIVSVVYAAISVVPSQLSIGFPYVTPFTKPIHAIVKIIAYIVIGLVGNLGFGLLSAIWGRRLNTTWISFGTCVLSFLTSKKRMEKVIAPKDTIKHLDTWIVQKTMDMVQSDRSRVTAFVATVPSFLQSPYTVVSRTSAMKDAVSTFDSLITFLIFPPTIDSNILDTKATRVHRVMTAISALWHIESHLRGRQWVNILPDLLANNTVARNLVPLKKDPNPIISIHAQSVVAFTVHVTFHHMLTSSFEETESYGHPESSYVRQYMDSPESLKAHCISRQDMIRNAPLIYTTCLISNLLPHLLSPNDFKLDLVWSTIDIMTQEIRMPIEADPPIRDAFMGLWRDVLVCERAVADRALPFSEGETDYNDVYPIPPSGVSCFHGSAPMMTRIALLVEYLGRVHNALQDSSCRNTGNDGQNMENRGMPQAVDVQSAEPTNAADMV